MDFKKNPKTHFKKVDKINKSEAGKQIEALREGIEYHDYLYYVKNKPKISDRTYDRLLARLEELEQAFPDLQSEDSPTKRVGAEPVSELRKKEHAAEMLSLNAALDERGARNFDRYIRKRIDRKPQYVLEPKFDGLSVEIVYKNGRFEYGATRGNGRTGEDISHNIRTIHTVPLRMRNGSENLPSMLAVRGEIFMPKDKFQDLNKQRVENGQEPFANPRNAAAGTVRQLDPANVVDKPLDIIFYEILKIDGCEFKAHWKMLGRLADWGFKTDRHNEKCSSFRKIASYREQMVEDRDELDYEIDGIVVKLDDYELRDELGVRQRSPRWALAWKFEPKEEVTTLREIAVQVGRTGMLTPVALLEPVDVGGVTVSRATLHNEQQVHEKDIRVGDKVRIERAGDVIPEVAERIKQRGKKRRKPFSMPEKCPSCGAKIYKEGAYYFCPASMTCRAQLTGRVIHYASKKALDIEGLGDETAEELVRKKMVAAVPDLYKLSVQELKKLDTFAEKSARRLHDEIQQTRKVAMDRFIYALGIRHVGEHMARVLAREYRKIEDLAGATVSDLTDIDEIGSEIAQSIHNFFKQKNNRDALRRFREAGVRPQPLREKTKKRNLEGKTFVFTGELDNYTRSEAKRLVESHGGRATSSVSSKTDYVVVGEDPGSKRDEARKEDVQLIDEKRFQKLLK